MGLCCSCDKDYILLISDVKTDFSSGGFIRFKISVLLIKSSLGITYITVKILWQC